MIPIYSTDKDGNRIIIAYQMTIFDYINSGNDKGDNANVTDFQSEGV